MLQMHLHHPHQAFAALTVVTVSKTRHVPPTHFLKARVALVERAQESHIAHMCVMLKQRSVRVYCPRGRELRLKRLSVRCVLYTCQLLSFPTTFTFLLSIFGSFHAAEHILAATLSPILVATRFAWLENHRLRFAPFCNSSPTQ